MRTGGARCNQARCRTCPLTRSVLTRHVLDAPTPGPDTRAGRKDDFDDPSALDLMVPAGD